MQKINLISQIIMRISISAFLLIATIVIGNNFTMSKLEIARPSLNAKTSNTFNVNQSLSKDAKHYYGERQPVVGLGYYDYSFWIGYYVSDNYGAGYWEAARITGD